MISREYEQELHRQGIAVVAGIDEVGRGPLAGPVVACALILEAEIEGVDDSKKLSEKKRERLYGEITAAAKSVGIGCVAHDVIDRINILQATHRAMAEALAALEPQPQHVLIDGNFVGGIAVPQTAIVGGDGKSYLIAAASIVAKVTRDRMMRRWHDMYPEYGFASNKGYGTKAHIAAIEQHGLSPIHRVSFCGRFVRQADECDAPGKN